MRKFCFIGCVCLLLSLSGMAQNGIAFQEQYQLHIQKSDEPIKIDGQLDETSWKTASIAGDFWECWPNDQSKAKRKTEVRVTYNDQFIFIGVVLQDTSHHVVQTLKRDNGLYDSDAFSVALDPVNQRTNGFIFSVNAYNVQTEDLVSPLNGFELNYSWDNKWYSATHRHETFWTAEIAIPFRTLRYNNDKTIWGVNFFRSDVKNNQGSSWTNVPVNFPFYDFGYSGALIWDQPPPPPGTNISFVPYITGSGTHDRESGEPLKGKINGGFDAKVAITPSLNLDLTVNPDFSQIEVDRQVTNLTRFNIFFPERRTFFLENSDLFSNYGIDPIRPFYSRRIGLDNKGNTIPIAGGVRLSGNLTKKFRVGIMNMQTLAKGDFNAQNYTAVTFNQQVQKRSILKGYFLNRQGFESGSRTFKDPLDAYGRNAGLEYNFIDATGKWNGWASYHRSFKPGISSHERYLDLGFGYTGKKFTSVFDFSDISSHFYTDMGFVQRIENFDAKLDTTFRLGFKHLFNETQLRLFPEKKKIARHELGAQTYIVWNPDGSFNERQNDFTYELLFHNTVTLTAGVSDYETVLQYFTSFTDKEPLMPGKYRYTQAFLSYFSDYRKKIYFNTKFTHGGFYNGKMTQFSLTLTWRVQPWGNFALNLQQSSLVFPEIHGKNNLLLIAPRIEINFSNNLFWTTFLQYNNQNNNFNINSRLQWRYKPMSDFFLVYTDNYFTDPLFKNKNRALVFKMNYWLNL